MRNIVGMPVFENNDFFRREFEFASIVKNLSKGESIYLLGQRRMGKTSLLRFVSRELSSIYNFTYIDLIDSYKESLNLNFIFSKINPQVDFDFKKDLTVTEFINLVDETKNNEKPIVLIFDEFPYYIENFSLNGKVKVESLLSIHREIRQSSNSKILFIYSGETSLYRYPLLESYLNDTVLIVMKPLSRDLTFEFIDKLSNKKSIKIIRAMKNKIYEYSKGIPFFIQLIFSSIELEKGKSRELTESILEDILFDLDKKKEHFYFPPPQNDSYKIRVKIETSLDLTNK